MIEPEDTDDVQRLIRLKRFEQPPEGFVDDFLLQFQHRQRSEILRHSSLSLFWERLATFMEGRVSPGMGLAGAAAAVLLVGGAIRMLPHGGTADATLAASHRVSSGSSQNGGEFTVSPEIGIAFAEDQMIPPQPPVRFAELLSKHFSGGYADEYQDKLNQGPAQMLRAGSQLEQDGSGDRALGQPLISTQDRPVQQNGSAANIQKQ